MNSQSRYLLTNRRKVIYTEDIRQLRREPCPREFVIVVAKRSLCQAGRLVRMDILSARVALRVVF